MYVIKCIEPLFQSGGGGGGGVPVVGFLGNRDIHDHNNDNVIHFDVNNE